MPATPLYPLGMVPEPASPDLAPVVEAMAYDIARARGVSVDVVLISYPTARVPHLAPTGAAA